MMKAPLVCFLAFVAFAAASDAKDRNFAVLVAFGEDDAVKEEICVMYFPPVHNLSVEMDGAEKFSFGQLYDLGDEETCPQEVDDQSDSLEGKVAIISATNSTVNCTIDQRAKFIEKNGGSGMIADHTVSTSFNASEAEPTKILVTSLFNAESRKKLLALKQSNPQGHFLVYAPPDEDRRVEGSIGIIFLMATFTLAVGSLWSGYTKHNIRLQRLGQALTISTGRDSASGRRHSALSNKSQGEELSVSITPLWVLIFVLCMCTMLILLYFFFNVLVYVIIGMFTLASFLATYACFEPLVLYSYSRWPNCPPILDLPILPSKCCWSTSDATSSSSNSCWMTIELRQLLLVIASAVMPIVWLVFMNEYWSWVLQDILGILFSLNMLRVLRLPSFKICTILLSVLFFYDIFFVFITPLFTKDGKSVMVEVATGGDSGQSLPMVLKVPHMGNNPLKSCYMPFAMLGFGDILVPGLLVSYCHAFDLLKGTPFKVYWTTTVSCYMLSLLVTFVSLFLMQSAQPALLYIVPLTLIPAALVALCRGEFKQFWLGDITTGAQQIRHQSNPRHDEEQGQDEPPGDSDGPDTDDASAEVAGASAVSNDDALYAVTAVDEQHGDKEASRRNDLQKLLD